MRRSNNKTVRFPSEESLCDYCCTETRKLSQQTILKLWYQSEDFQRFQIEAGESVNRALKTGLSVYIKQTYGCSDTKTQAKLNIWAKYQDTRRGLERFVNEEYGTQRLLHRRKAVQAVLHSQEKLCKDNQPYSRASSVIKTVSSTLSSNAVQFARMLAIADHEAVLALQEKTTKPNIRKAQSLPVPRRRSSKEMSPYRPPRHPGRPQIEFMIVSPIA